MFVADDEHSVVTKMEGTEVDDDDPRRNQGTSELLDGHRLGSGPAAFGFGD